MGTWGTRTNVHVPVTVPQNISARQKRDAYHVVWRLPATISGPDCRSGSHRAHQPPFPSPAPGPDFTNPGGLLSHWPPTLPQRTSFHRGTPFGSHSLWIWFGPWAETPLTSLGQPSAIWGLYWDPEFLSRSITNTLSPRETGIFSLQGSWANSCFFPLLWDQGKRSKNLSSGPVWGWINQLGCLPVPINNKIQWSPKLLLRIVQDVIRIQCEWPPRGLSSAQPVQLSPEGHSRQLIV